MTRSLWILLTLIGPPSVKTSGSSCSLYRSAPELPDQNTVTTRKRWQSEDGKWSLQKQKQKKRFTVKVAYKEALFILCKRHFVTLKPQTLRYFIGEQHKGRTTTHELKGNWKLPGGGSTLQEPTHAPELHAERPQSLDSNLWPSCCRATVLPAPTQDQSWLFHIFLLSEIWKVWSAFTFTNFEPVFYCHRFSIVFRSDRTILTHENAMI